MENCVAFTKPQQQRSRDALSRVVTSAVSLFSRQSFAATRVSDIAQHAQVPVGTVYQYFADKEALLLGIFAGYRDCRMREIRTIFASAQARDATPHQLIALHLNIVFSAFTQDAGLLRLIELRRLEDAHMHRKQSEANDEVASLFAELLIPKMPDRDAHELRRQVLYVHSIIRGAVVWSILPPGGEMGRGLQITDADFANEALQMSLRYLGIEG